MHKSRAKCHVEVNEYLYNAIRKYEWENIEWEVADGYESWDELCETEIKTIAALNTCDKAFGYNISVEGDGNAGWHMSEERKMAQSKLMKETGNNPRKYWNDEVQKRFLANCLRGKDHPLFGKPRDPLIVEKVKLSNIANIENSDNTILSWEKADDITNKYKSGASIKEIAAHYGVGWATVSDIVKCRTRVRDGITRSNIESCRAKNKNGLGTRDQKLTDMLVQEIKQRYLAGGCSMSQLAKEYGVSSSYISNIINGKRRQRHD
jgi:transposase